MSCRIASVWENSPQYTSSRFSTKKTRSPRRHWNGSIANLASMWTKKEFFPHARHSIVFFINFGFLCAQIRYAIFILAYLVLGVVCVNGQVAFHQVGGGDHVVTEEQEEGTIACLGPCIARCPGATVGGNEGLCTTQAGNDLICPVDDNQDLEAVDGLLAESGERVLEDFQAAPGGNDNREVLRGNLAH